MRHATDWDRIIESLPPELRAQVESTMRTVLKRRLKRLPRPDAPVSNPGLVPDIVRSQAIGKWRKRYMKGSSISARKRMNYARLRDEPTYQAIELEELGDYWTRRLGTNPHDLPSAAHVDDMPFSEVCEAVCALGPQPGSTGLEHLVSTELQRAYTERVHVDAIYADLAHAVRDAARKRDLATYARVKLDDQPFHLRGVTDAKHVAERVRKARLVERVIVATYGRSSALALATQLLQKHLRSDKNVRALKSFMAALLDGPPPPNSRIQRLVRRDAHRIVERLRSSELASLVADDLLHNPFYGKQFEQSVELLLHVREQVPTAPMDAFPLARTMNRHFVIHVGTTNSGKTHDALQTLADARSGTYLGPLRLLAYEQFERLNHDGCPCSLLTGEEAIEVAGAKHTSSTVEMADFVKPVEVAVIDEAQMMADPSRGHHWTDAILGIPANEVHVCCAPHALRVVCKLIRLCEDTYNVVRHERLVPLRRDAGSFRLPDDVRPGDALVVFSRKSVHTVAATVRAAGFNPSLVYGALPYEVRHEEARKFDEGETDVVVATDAIGMGMNLPIQRVVFVEQEKFDGQEFRLLRADEVQQIAGRAGRYGRYDVGYFQSTHMRKAIARRCAQPVPDIESIAVGIPANIALVRDATLSDSIRQWMSIKQPEPFARIDVSRDLRLVSKVEELLDSERATDIETKHTVLALATMPFDERDRRLMDAWQQMARIELEKNPELESSELEPLPEPSGKTLAQLEADYHYCDLLYTYERTFRKNSQRTEELVTCRNRIARTIMDILDAT